MAYRFGIDAGSKTIKLVVTDDSGTIVQSLYRRHRSDIKTTLSEVLHEMVWRHGDMEGTIGITGSAGIGLASLLDLPFIQEVVATTHAVQTIFPEADAFIELGGEDAKVVYLTGGLEQRMNATCAGGTGGFIDTIAFMIGSHSREMSTLALGANRIYPIASRCAVFAQTDVRPLLNAGAKPSDIAASALEAVVRQTLGGLACGRPITGNVVFLGGPFEFIPELVRRFRKALGLTHRNAIKPEKAHLFTARGAALLAAKEDAPTISLAWLEQLLAKVGDPENDLPRLPRLFESEEELRTFGERHARARIPRRSLFASYGNLYIGLDAGSTAVKLVALDDEGQIVYSDYQPTGGDVLKTAAGMLEKLHIALPKNTRGETYAHIAHATVTGYGEEILKAGLGIDSGVVETLAHVRAAQAFQPNLTFLLDIGGQDMKAIWIKDGHVTNAVLNEACSSGCGSFIEGTAYSLRHTPQRFSEEALKAKSPVDLGTKCTVFMTSRVRHAQKVGVPVSDIAAGIAYSVVKNALFRIIGMNKLDSLGDCVVVQGGAFMSDAVLRAFEQISGLEVVRPNAANLMGAMGAALTARMRAQEQESPTSSLISLDDLKELAPRRTAQQCPGCENACALSVVDFGKGNLFVSGGKCSRALVLIQNREAKSHSLGKRPPNAMELEQKLLARFGDKDGFGGRSAVRVGLLNVLHLYEQMPFWHTLLSKLGFSVLVPSDARARETGSEREGVGTIPSESVCYPAKLSHLRLYDLANSGATGVFMPTYRRGSGCPVASEYALAVKDSAPVVREGGKTLVSPMLSSSKLHVMMACEKDRAALRESLNSLVHQAECDFVTKDELDEALREALKAQRSFEQMVLRANKQALAWVHERPRRRGVVLAGRPYHADPALLHGIDRVLVDVGFAALSPLALPETATSPCVDGVDEKTAAAGKATGAGKATDGDKPREGEWTASKRFERLSLYVARRPELEMVCLQSFGCTFDAVNLLSARDILENAGHPFTALKIDDMADTAHIRIRLRTLAETLELTNWRETEGEIEDEGEIGRMREAESESEGDSKCEDAAAEAPVLCKSQDVLGAIELADLDEAQGSVPNDVCFVASALAGRAIRLLKEDPGIAELRLPRVCERCLVDALPAMIEHAAGRRPRIEWTQEIPAANQIALEPKRGETGERRPRIGIIGCSLLCFDKCMNENVVEFVESQGCEAVLPRVESLFIDDVRYVDELERFADMGVDHVIYLQSFGCLKGHICARGALHELAERFPNMPITVLDYDPEASALNRENRIRLALAAAKNGR